MSVFRQPEWDNFVRVTGQHPRSWPGYAWELSGLVWRRLANVLRMKLSGSDHRGLKSSPEWLVAEDIGRNPARGGGMSFPSHPNVTQRLPPNPADEMQFAAADPEGYLFRHRWGNCFAAALDDKAAAEAALAHALSWIRNPPARSDAAWEPYSSCERVVNLAVMLSVHPGCRREVETRYENEISQFLADSIAWIGNRLEYYGMARTNNHILNNARALVVAGSVLGDEAALERGLLLFDRMAQVLFLPEGFLRERSSHYQCVVANWLLDALHFATAANPAQGRAQRAMANLNALSARVSRATALLVRASEGMNTQIGDISPDCTPAAAISRIRCLYPEALAGPDGNANWRHDEWLSVSDGKHRLLSCGLPENYPFEYTTHGHPDLCGFIWALGGNPVLVDAGRAGYLDTPGNRRQAGPEGHNVLTVQGLPPLAESLLTSGRWCPRPYAQAKVRIEHRSESGFLIEHDGFGRISGVGRHARSILIDGDGISVQDRIDGTGIVDVEMFWHFAPGLAPLGDSAVAGRGMQFDVRLGGSDRGAARLRWEEYPFSAAYGDVQQAYMLRVTRTTSLPWLGTTTLRATQCAA